MRATWTIDGDANHPAAILARGARHDIDALLELSDYLHSSHFYIPVLADLFSDGHPSMLDADDSGEKCFQIYKNLITWTGFYLNRYKENPMGNFASENLRDAKPIFDAIGKLLRSRHAKNNWYRYCRDLPVMNGFAQFGMTDYFCEAIEKGVSITAQYAGMTLFHRTRRFDETPLDVALKYKQLGIVALIDEQIKKDVRQAIDLISKKQPTGKITLRYGKRYIVGLEKVFEKHLIHKSNEATTHSQDTIDRFVIEYLQIINAKRDEQLALQEHQKTPQKQTQAAAQQQNLTPIVGTVITDLFKKLATDLQTAIDRLHDERFSFLGKEKRQQKVNVLEAALLLINSDAKNVDAFVKSLEDNPDYSFAFQPGKTPETVRLVRELVSLYPALRTALEARRDQLNTQKEKQLARRRTHAGLFDRLQQAVATSSEDKALSALQLIVVPNTTLPIAVGVPIQEFVERKKAFSAA